MSNELGTLSDEEVRAVLLMREEEYERKQKLKRDSCYHAIRMGSSYCTKCGCFPENL